MVILRHKQVIRNIINGVERRRSQRFVHRRTLISLRFGPGGLNLGRVSCRVELVVDSRGVPRDAQVRDCPRAFHDSAREALLKWRYYPARDASGQRVQARTLVVIHYDVR